MDLKKVMNDFSIDTYQLVETIVTSDLRSVILFKNTKSEIIYVNDRFFKKHPQFNHDRNSVLGKTDYDLFPNSLEHASQAFQDEQEVIQTGVPINLLESEGVDDHGRSIIAHTIKYPVYNHNHDVVGIMVITEDMTSDINVLRENQERTHALSLLNKELTIENTIDSLSQLYNRRFIDARLSSLEEKFKENEITFSVLMIDVDNFKTINDTYGHHIGDQVIHYIGAALKNVKREEYSFMEACRYGGDEFMVIVPGYQINGALAVAHTIKQYLIKHPYTYKDITINVECCIGIASMNGHTSITSLLKEADEYMYLAKKSGKNQIKY